MNPNVPVPEVAPEAPANEPAAGQQQGAAAGGVIPAPESPAATAPAIGSSALSKLGRELRDEDLNHAGVQKMLLYRGDKAEDDCRELQKYVEKFHERDKEAAVLEAKLNTSTAFEVLCAGGFGGGGILLGIAPSIQDKHYIGGVLAFVVGGVFVAASIVARLVQVRR